MCSVIDCEVEVGAVSCDEGSLKCAATLLFNDFSGQQEVFTLSPVQGLKTALECLISSESVFFLLRFSNCSAI